MDEFVPLLPPLIGLVLNCLVQIAAFRQHFFKLLASAVFGFVAGGAVTALAHVRMIDSTVLSVDGGALLLANLTAYGALGYTYFHFINMGETARRIRILIELVGAGGDGLDEGRILSRYNAREMVERRLDRLFSKGQIIETGDRLFPRSGLVMWMAKGIWMLKKLLGL